MTAVAGDARCSIVITTINSPTPPIVALAEGSLKAGFDLIVLGDQSSPPDFHQEGAHYFDIAQQAEMNFRLAALVPLRSYARKNLGYLEAVRRGSDIIIETDDDNAPTDAFWVQREIRCAGYLQHSRGWVNCYRHFSKAKIWPRGFPLDLATAPFSPGEHTGAAGVECPIQQGLADANPDVDAIYRLIMPLPFYFDDAEPLILSGASWCPLNSQNTTWWRRAFPLLYLPSFCSFRMTDIWRGFVAQRVAAANGWNIAFHAPTMVQDRNEHDLMRDFADEISGYLHSKNIMADLAALEIRAGEAHLADAMRKSYESLIGAGLVDEREWPLLNAWLGDVEELMEANS